MPDAMRTLLSFVIPALNEAEGIERCVSSIAQWVPEELDYEVIVVDNGSTDATASLAAAAGARVIRSSAGTISAVRNQGVAETTGEILVFIDADCALTPEWSEGASEALNVLGRSRLACVGSQVAPPSGESVFLWDYWFRPFVDQATASHIGSAHMIMSRDTFNHLGGFDERLATSEDYDICARLEEGGGVILNLPGLRVDHFDFPRTFSAFVKRERWHGTMDMMGWTSFRRSKVAIASMLFTGSCLAGPLLAIIGQPLVGFGVFLGAPTSVLLTICVKFRHAGPRVWSRVWLIVPIYFLGRTLAVADAVRRRRMQAT
jgi:glycosyltransferase involved in cell wall biosynthesis